MLLISRIIFTPTFREFDSTIKFNTSKGRRILWKIRIRYQSLFSRKSGLLHPLLSFLPRPASFVPQFRSCYRVCLIAILFRFPRVQLGAWPVRAYKSVTRFQEYIILRQAGSQFKRLSNCVIISCFLDAVSVRDAEFCTKWSLPVVPYLQASF